MALIYLQFSFDSRHVTTWTSGKIGAVPVPQAGASCGPQSALYDIDIVGLRTVLDRRTGPLRRGIWAAILTTSSVVMLWQTYDRISSYVDDSVTSNIRYISNGSMVFPALTLCPYRNDLQVDWIGFKLIEFH